MPEKSCRHYRDYPQIFCTGPLVTTRCGSTVFYCSVRLGEQNCQIAENRSKLSPSSSGLPGSHRQAQRVAQPIHGDMDFGTESTTATSQRLRFRTTCFLGRRLRTDERAQWWNRSSIFHIRVIGKVLEHPFPDAPVTPAGKPLIDRIPFPVFVW